MEFGKTITLEESDEEIPFEDISQRIKYYNKIKKLLIDFKPELDGLLFNNKYTLCELSKGSSGDMVYNYYNTFAIKKIDLKNTIEPEILKNMTTFVIENNFPHFPMMYAFNKCDTHQLLICEKADDNLWNTCSSNNLVYQCFVSIYFLHKLGYIHKDSHSGNFLVHKVCNNTIKEWTYTINDKKVSIPIEEYLIVIWDFGKSQPIQGADPTDILLDYFWQFPTYLKYISDKKFDFELDRWKRIINYDSLEGTDYKSQNLFNRNLLKDIPFNENDFMDTLFSENKNSFGNNFDKDINFLKKLI